MGGKSSATDDVPIWANSLERQIQGLATNGVINNVEAIPVSVLGHILIDANALIIDGRCPDAIRGAW